MSEHDHKAGGAVALPGEPAANEAPPPNGPSGATPPPEEENAAPAAESIEQIDASLADQADAMAEPFDPRDQTKDQTAGAAHDDDASLQTSRDPAAEENSAPLASAPPSSPPAPPPPPPTEAGNPAGIADAPPFPDDASAPPATAATAATAAKPTLRQRLGATSSLVTRATAHATYRTLVAVNAPAGRLSPELRRGVGYVGLLTLFNALCLIAYCLLRSG